MLEITYLNTEELIPYARNSRTHSDAQVSQIMGSIKEFGFTNPILIDTDGGIIAGHGRLLAAQRLGMATVPTITLDGLSETQRRAYVIIREVIDDKTRCETQRRAYVIADNKLALNAGWDEEMLKLELQDLEQLGFDIDLTGFSADEISALDVEVEDYSEKNKEFDAGDFEDQKYTIKLEFTEDDYSFVVDKIKQLGKSPEAILYDALI